MEAIFINGTRANFEQMLYEAARRAVQDLIPEPIPKDQPLKIDVNRIYNLSNPDIVRLFGVENHKKPQVTIARKLRAAGIDVSIKQRSGSTVTGYQLINYFDGIRAKNYLKKAQ